MFFMLDFIGKLSQLKNTSFVKYHLSDPSLLEL